MTLKATVLFPFMVIGTALTLSFSAQGSPQKVVPSVNEGHGATEAKGASGLFGLRGA